MYVLLTYEGVEDYVARREPLRAAHLEHARRAQERGDLLLAGALGDPVDGSGLLFRGPSTGAAEEFARADPYVVQGLVTRWQVRPWNTVAGTLLSPLGPAAGPSLSGRLTGQLQALSFILKGASDLVVTARPLDGRWSAHENLAHLARSHEVFLERLARILAEDRPALARYRAEEDDAWPAWAALSPGQVMTRLGALRAELSARIGALSETELARRGVHSTHGPLSVPEWLEFFLLHEAHHLYVALGRVAAARTALAPPPSA